MLVFLYPIIFFPKHHILGFPFRQTWSSFYPKLCFYLLPSPRSLNKSKLCDNLSHVRSHSFYQSSHIYIQHSYNTQVPLFVFGHPLQELHEGSHRKFFWCSQIYFWSKTYTPLGVYQHSFWPHIFQCFHIIYGSKLFTWNWSKWSGCAALVRPKSVLKST